jgi:hypothetical protein
LSRGELAEGAVRPGSVVATRGRNNTHRPHRTLKQTAPLRPLPDGVTDLDHFRVQRRDRAGGVIVVFCRDSVQASCGARTGIPASAAALASRSS